MKYCLLALLMLPLTLSAVSVDIPPFIYRGRITNDQRQGLDVVAGGKATISAYKGETLLAKSSIVTVEGVDFNYRLLIPMGTSDTPAEELTKVAIPGDRLSFIVFDGTSSYALPEDLVELVGNPGRASTTNFSTAVDSNNNGIADSYEEFMKDYEGNPHPGEFDPDADYDGDGYTNRQEYELGTNPFDANDAFKLVSFKPVPNQPTLFEVTFLTTRGRNYRLLSETKLEALPQFKDDTFRKEAKPEAATYNVYNEGNESAYRTIYLLKLDDAGFFRLRAE